MLPWRSRDRQLVRKVFPYALRGCLVLSEIIFLARLQALDVLINVLLSRNITIFCNLCSMQRADPTARYKLKKSSDIRLQNIRLKIINHSMRFCLCRQRLEY